MSEIPNRGVDRVSIDTQFHELYRQLSDGADPEMTPFRTMKDVFMLAACVGYQRGQRHPITGSKRQIFHWTQFSEQVDVPILKALAIASTGDIMVLADQQKILQLAEEYANAGIHEINTHVLDQPGQPLWSLVDLIRSM